MTDRYQAKSASDRTDDWPFWYVADTHRGSLNVTNQLVELTPGAVFTSKEIAEMVCKIANREATIDG